MLLLLLFGIFIKLIQSENTLNLLQYIFLYVFELKNLAEYSK